MKPFNSKNLCRRYLAGETLKDLAKLMGTRSTKPLRRILKEAGIPIRIKNPVLPTQEIIDRYLAKETTSSIAESFRSTRASVLKLLRENGVKIRTASESHFIRMARY